MELRGLSKSDFYLFTIHCIALDNHFYFLYHHCGTVYYVFVKIDLELHPEQLYSCNKSTYPMHHGQYLLILEKNRFLFRYSFHIYTPEIRLFELRSYEICI